MQYSENNERERKGEGSSRREALTKRFYSSKEKKKGEGKEVLHHP